MEAAARAVRAAPAARSAERAVPAVVPERALGKDALGLGTEVPAQEIEMVGRLVHEEAAAVFGVGMPAAEVIGTVLDIEVPVEIDRDDLADGTREQQLLDPLRSRRAAVVEGNVEPPACALLGVENAPDFRGGGRHRFFGDDVDTRLERLHDVLVVKMIARADDQRLGPRLAE